ncbi:MAG: hypothetical protein Q9160_003325 [Pyrenula sp. 1 TL-2023]
MTNLKRYLKKKRSAQNDEAGMMSKRSKPSQQDPGIQEPDLVNKYKDLNYEPMSAQHDIIDAGHNTATQSSGFFVRDSEDDLMDIETSWNRAANTSPDSIFGICTDEPNTGFEAQKKAANSMSKSPPPSSKSKGGRRRGPMSEEKKSIMRLKTKQTRERNANINQELTQAKKDKKVLQAQLEQNNTELQTFKERLRECQEAAALVQNTADERERKLLELESKKTAGDVNEEIDAKAKRICDLRLRIWVDAVKLSTAKIKLKKHAQERGALQDALNNSRVESDQLRHKYLMAEKQSRDKKWNALSRGDHDNTALQKLRDNHQENIAQKTRELSQCQEELSAFQASLLECREALSACEERHANSVLEDNQLQNDVASLKQRLDAVRQETSSLRDEAQVSSRSLSILKDANRKLEKELESAQSEASTLQQQFTETRSHLQNTRTELSTYQTEASTSNKALENTISQKDTTLADQARQIASLTTEIAELRVATAAATPKTPAPTLPPLSSPPISPHANNGSPPPPKPLALSAFGIATSVSATNTEVVSNVLKDPRLKSISFCGPTLEVERD